VSPSGRSRPAAELLRKYRAMLQLRAEAVGNEARERLRALAAEFPGALRELDRTATAELQRRADACARAAAGDEAESWIAWMARYHELVRERLAARRADADTLPRAPVARRAGERLNEQIVRQLSDELDVPRDTLERALFPPRRRR
jgi:hypothetical protein